MIMAPCTRLTMSQAMTQKAGDGEEGGEAGDLPQADRRAGDAEGDDAGLVQADEGEEEADADGEAVLEGTGDGVGQPAAHLEDGEDGEEDAGEEDGAEGRLPGIAEHLDDGEGDEGVLPHVGGDGKGALGVDAHDQGAEGGGDDGGGHRRPARDTGRLQDRRVDDDDVGHGQEGGDAGHGFLTIAGLVAGEIEVAVHVLHRNIW